MVKLTEYDDALAAERLMERLEDAGIEATLQPTHDIFAQPTTAVLIVHRADLEGARELMAGPERELHEAPRHDESYRAVCKGCGYSLGGLTGDGRCPECGRAYKGLPTAVFCRGCDAEVPANFDACWKCGKPLNACPACGATLPDPDATACAICGAALEPLKPVPISAGHEQKDAAGGGLGKKPWWKIW